MSQTCIFFIVLTICVTALIALAIWLNHKSYVGSPEHGCAHDYDTIQTWSGSATNQYLSTCKKCGKQTNHAFGNRSY